MAKDPAAQWAPPLEFDDFRVVRPLGRGGMGQVYLGHDEALDRPVALKFLSAERPDAGARERFLIEARAIARLQHPNVAAIFRIGEANGKPYLAYEFVRGQSLDRLEKPLPWQTALHVSIGLTRGLAAVHRRGVLHRDVKPANVVLSDTGEVKLIDFGLAKLSLGALAVASSSAAWVGESSTPAPSVMSPSFHGSTLPTARSRGSASFDETAPQSGGQSALTRTGEFLGTPLYCAPEIWRGSPAGAHSDVYALGLVVYELFSGRLPWEHTESLEALKEVVLSHSRVPLAAVAPGVPTELTDVIDRCVLAAPNERFASAEEVRIRIEAAHAFARATERAGWGPEKSEDDGWRVAESFARLNPRADLLVERFYARLFSSSPGLRPLFPANLTEQRGKLAAALRLSVEALGQPDRLAPMLEELGRRHAAYGARPEHFSVLGAALLDSLAELEGSAWTPALATAWQRAYASIATSMQRGLLGGQRVARD